MWRSINKTIKNPEALTTLVRNVPHMKPCRVDEINAWASIAWKYSITRLFGMSLNTSPEAFPLSR